MVWASEEEQDLVFQELDDDTLSFILFQASHGTRNGETRALQFRDIDLKNDTITIRRSFAGTVLRETTKSKRIRVIPLDPAWKEMFLKRPIPLRPDMFVFTKKGKPYSSTWMSKQYNKALKKANVKKMTLYQATRHSLASQAASRGVSIYLISKMLGHSDVKMTQKYAHLYTESLRPAQRNHSNLLAFCKPSAKAKQET